MCLILYIYFPTEPHSMQGSNYIVCTVIDFFRTTHLPFIIICCLFVWIAITDVAIYRNGGSWKIRDLVRRKSTKTRRVTKKLYIFLSTFILSFIGGKSSGGGTHDILWSELGYNKWLGSAVLNSNEDYLTCT